MKRLNVSILAVVLSLSGSSSGWSKSLEDASKNSDSGLNISMDSVRKQVSVRKENRKPAVSEPYCNMFNESACLLNSESDSRSIAVHYSNLAFCGLKILVSTTRTVPSEVVEDLARSLKIQVLDKDVPQENPTVEGSTLRVSFGSSRLYVLMVQISSRDGKSMDQTIRKAVADSFNPNPIAVAVPIACQSN